MDNKIKKVQEEYINEMKAENGIVDADNSEEINEEKDFFVAINKIFHKNFTNLEQLNSIYELLLSESINSNNFKATNSAIENA